MQTHGSLVGDVVEQKIYAHAGGSKGRESVFRFKRRAEGGRS